MSIRSTLTHAAVASLLCAGLLGSAEAGTLGKSTVGTTNYPMSFQGRLPLESADSSVACSTVVDGQVFLGTETGRVIQVDLDSLKRTKSIDAGLDLSNTGTATCAADGGSIYFTTLTVDFLNSVQITKVDLQSLSVVARKEHVIAFARLQSTSARGGFIYLALSDEQGVIAKVDAATLESAGRLTLELGESVTRCHLIEKGFGYFGTQTFGGLLRVVKVDLSTMTEVASIELENGDGSLGTGVASDGFGFFPSASGQFLRVIKLDLDPFTRVGRIEVDGGVNSYATLRGGSGSAVVSDGFALFGIGFGSFAPGPPVGSVVRVDLSNFTVSEVMPLDGMGPPDSAYASGASVYFGSGTDDRYLGHTGKILKFDGSTFEKTAELSLSPGEDSLSCALRVGDQAYFGGVKNPGHIVQVDLSTLTRVRSLDLETDERLLLSAVQADGFGYFGTYDGKIVKVDLTTLSRVDALQLGPGETAPASAVASGGFAYFASGGVPGKVVKLDLGTFARVGSIELPRNGGEIKSSVILGNFAYFGLERGQIARIDLQSFSTVETLSLARGEAIIKGAVAVGKFLYFLGQRSGDLELLKVDSRSFERVRASVLKGEEGTLPGSMVTDGRSVFLGTSERIVRIDLTSMQRSGALSLPSDLDLRTAVTDGVAAYFGASSSSFGFPGEGRVLKAGLGAPNGMIHATRAVLRAAATPRSINFYAHDAGGTLRLAIYDTAKNLVWQSAPIRVRRANSILSVPVSRGTPAQLRLRPGTYYLAWQIDSNRRVPSYKRGTNGSGWSLQQPFGPFPAQITGEVTNHETWTEFVSY